MGWPLRRAKSKLNYKKRAASTQRSSKSRGRRSSPRSGLTRIKATPLLQTINQGWWNASFQWRIDDLFAAIPPLESRRAILAICGAREAGRHPYRIMALDVARAYFYSPASRTIFVRIPAEDRLDSEAGKVAQLNPSFYGTRDAAKNWTTTYTEFRNGVGFKTSFGCSCNFSRRTRQVSFTVRGDDFTASGSDSDLAWLEGQFKERFECKIQVLGPGRNQQREVRILNTVVKWSKHGIYYEADQRHSKIVVREMGLENAKTVPTAGAREEQKAASVPSAAQRVEVVEESRKLGARDARAFHGVAARCKYLAQDRVDLQYATKEASRCMAKPRPADWGLFKRLGRYLLGAPRLVKLFRWQALPRTVDVFTDSD